MQTLCDVLSQVTFLSVQHDALRFIGNALRKHQGHYLGGLQGSGNHLKSLLRATFNRLVDAMIQYVDSPTADTALQLLALNTINVLAQSEDVPFITKSTVLSRLLTTMRGTAQHWNPTQVTVTRHAPHNAQVLIGGTHALDSTDGYDSSCAFVVLIYA